jgi:hypothetical protein
MQLSLMGQHISLHIYRNLEKYRCSPILYSWASSTQETETSLCIIAMDPLTVLGAASSAAQLLQQGTQLVKFLYDLRLKMKEAPEKIQRQSRQVQQLSLFLELFLHNASLQKDSVALVLNTCLQRSQELQSYLDDMSPNKAKGRLRKFRRAFKSVVKEHDTAILFDSLEREKTSLMLCIQEIDE